MGVVTQGSALAGRNQPPCGHCADIANLKSRIAATVDFVQNLPRAEIDTSADAIGRKTTIRHRSDG
jgi:hypothetical protein